MALVTSKHPHLLKWVASVMSQSFLSASSSGRNFRGGGLFRYLLSLFLTVFGCSPKSEDNCLAVLPSTRNLDNKCRRNPAFCRTFVAPQAGHLHLVVPAAVWPHLICFWRHLHLTQTFYQMHGVTHPVTQFPDQTVNMPKTFVFTNTKL